MCPFHVFLDQHLSWFTGQPNVRKKWVFGSIVGKWRTRSAERQLACLSYDRSTCLRPWAEVQNISAIWWCIRAVCIQGMINLQYENILKNVMPLRWKTLN